MSSSSEHPTAARAAPAYTPDHDPDRRGARAGLRERATDADDPSLTPAQRRRVRAALAWAWRHRVIHVVVTVLLGGSWPGVRALLAPGTAGSGGTAHDSVQDARLATFDTAYARSLAERRELRESVGQIRTDLRTAIRIGCRGLQPAERELIDACLARPVLSTGTLASLRVTRTGEVAP